MYTGFCTGPLSFLSHLNDFPKDISSTTKLFPDDTFIFSIVNDTDIYEHDVNSDLRISIWAYHWKMCFNSDVSKQAQEVIFSKKNKIK